MLVLSLSKHVFKIDLRRIINNKDFSLQQNVFCVFLWIKSKVQAFQMFTWTFTEADSASTSLLGFVFSRTNNFCALGFILAVHVFECSARPGD